MRLSALRFVIATISVLLLGCASKNPEEIASKIQVDFPVSQEISKASGTGWDVELTNESNYCVIFPLVTGMTIYTELGGKQLEVENMVNIIGSENLYLNPRGEIFSKMSVGILPDISNVTIEKPTQFFARLSGYLCEDENTNIIKTIPFTVTP